MLDKPLSLDSFPVGVKTRGFLGNGSNVHPTVADSFNPVARIIPISVASVGFPSALVAL